MYALDLAKKETTPLSHDHKPELPGEKERIVLSGGTVENVDGVWRVDGTLAMSRAFGDAVGHLAEHLLCKPAAF